MSVTSALRIQRAINARRAERSSGAVITTVAADFLHGRAPMLCADVRSAWNPVQRVIQRAPDEGWAAFTARARVESTHKTAGACSPGHWRPS